MKEVNDAIDQKPELPGLRGPLQVVVQRTSETQEQSPALEEENRELRNQMTQQKINYESQLEDSSRSLSELRTEIWSLRRGVLLAPGPPSDVQS